MSLYWCHSMPGCDSADPTKHNINCPGGAHAAGFREGVEASAKIAEGLGCCDDEAVAMADHRKMLAVVQVLRDIEWQCVDVTGDSTCPHCWGVKPTHRGHCALAAAIRG